MNLQSIERNTPNGVAKILARFTVTPNQKRDEINRSAPVMARGMSSVQTDLIPTKQVGGTVRFFDQRIIHPR